MRARRAPHQDPHSPSTSTPPVAPTQPGDDAAPEASSEPDALPPVGPTPTELDPIAPADTETDADAAVGPDEVADTADVGLPPLQLGLDDRVPVIPLYSWGTISQDCGQLSDEVEPVLSIGMLLAHAWQCREGVLNEAYDFVRIRPDSTAVLAAWAQDPRPAVFLFSDYLWNVDQHLEWGRMVKELSPESLCIHGGPSCPKYEADAAAFVQDNLGVDLAVRGEGELVFEELLVALDGDIDPLRLHRLAEVGSLTYLDHRERSAGAGAHPRRDSARGPRCTAVAVPERRVRRPARGAVALRIDRDQPRLSLRLHLLRLGLGDAVADPQVRPGPRAAPSSTGSWTVRPRPTSWSPTPTSGSSPATSEVAEHLAELRREYHLPYTITISGMAKNTVKHSVPIIQTLVRAGIGPIAAQSVQSTDEATLAAIRRHNIKLDRFDDMARAFQELGLPLVTDILMGLPGSTVESFKNDLQDCLDREVTARTMEILMLPNSPMNDPEYRDEWKVQADEFGVVCASSTFSHDDYEQMKRLRLLYRALDHFGLLRHVLRHLQWEHGIRSLDVIADMDDAILADPCRYPLLGFVARVFDIYTVPPVAWEPFFDEVVGFLSDRYDIELDSSLATVLSVQRFVLPARGRAFPETLELNHDYVEYRRDRAGARRG